MLRGKTKSPGIASGAFELETAAQLKVKSQPALKDVEFKVAPAYGAFYLLCSKAAAIRI
jgi:hypothetical protein